MIAQFSIRENWRELVRGRPGRRFQDRYDSQQCRHHQCGAAQRVFLMVAAAIALVLGLVLSVVPGPAIPFFFISGGLLATESLSMARFMDWIELKLRGLAAWGKRQWGRLTTSARVVVVVMLAAGSTAVVCIIYHFLAG